RRVVLWPPGSEYTTHRRPGCPWRSVSAGLRELRGLHRHARRADYGTVPVSVAHRTGRAARHRLSDHRVASKPPNTAVTAEEGRIQHDACRQVAPRRAP